MCNKAVSEDPFMLKSCHDRFKTNKADDDFPSAIKFVPDWFVTSKITKKFKVLYLEMIMYCFLMKILVMSHFLFMK